MSSRIKRDYVIDSLKGFSILLVVIGHVMDGYLNAGMFPKHHAVMYWCFRLIYAFHMPLFFVVSGYVYQLAYIKDGKVIPKIRLQILNVIVLYVVYSILFGGFKILCGSFTNSDVTIMDLLMIPVKSIAPYWYLYVLVLFYLLMSFPQLLKISYPYFLIVAVVLSLLSTFVNGEWLQYFEIRRFFYYLPFFYFGMLLKQNTLHVLNHKGICLLSLVVSIFLMVWFRDFSYGAYDLIPGWRLLIAFGCLLAVSQFFSLTCRNEREWHVRAFSFLGRYSLEIYLLHCVFTAGNRVILNKLHLQIFWLCIILNCAISTALPIMIAVVLKKCKLHDLAFKPVYFIQKRREKNNV